MFNRDIDPMDYLETDFEEHRFDLIKKIQKACNRLDILELIAKMIGDTADDYTSSETLMHKLDLSKKDLVALRDDYAEWVDIWLDEKRLSAYGL
jgi:hypothetical protein